MPVAMSASPFTTMAARTLESERHWYSALANAGGVPQ
jgi:hypothetical protein